MARSTAEGACALRAAGTTLRDPELRNPDYMARDFISPGLKMSALAKVPLVRRLGPRITERILPGALWFELARTRYMDDVLLREVADGATQVVLLGAGLDSRFYRLRDELGGAALFEVDHPVTAAVKAERLEAIFGDMPEHVNYVHVDFNAEDVGERLDTHGFDPAARSIVLWSGVTPYLEPDGVAESLRWFASGTGPGSAICFDYLWKEMLDGDDSYYGAAELRRRVEEGGEPFKFGIPRGGTKEFVERFGLVLEEHLGPDDAHERILHHAGEPYGFGGMALVRNPA
jgi:methyltransferase (TIGR00027 family)